MPAMLRPSGKASRIASEILGTPSNLRKTKSRRNKSDTEKRLTLEETRFVR